MCHDTNHLGESVQLQLVEELEGLHLEPVRSVGEQQHQVRHLRQVGHRVQVRGTLKQSDATLSASHTRDGSSSRSEVLSSIVPVVRKREGGREGELVDDEVMMMASEMRYEWCWTVVGETASTLTHSPVL